MVPSVEACVVSPDSGSIIVAVGRRSVLELATELVEALVDLVGPEDAACDTGDGGVLSQVGVLIRHARALGSGIKVAVKEPCVCGGY